jgi:acetyltransferase-like isoleucine patch superfamily enzyme
MLRNIKTEIEDGLTAQSTAVILEQLGGPRYPDQIIEDIKLYSETLPKGHEHPYFPQERYLQFLWEAFDKLPLALSVPFALPFRRMLAEYVFNTCGAAFLCEEGIRFNFGRYIDIGNEVFINRNCFLDSKGGITIGNEVAVGEDVRIFTHSHSEASHIERDYKPVVIKDYAKIYAGATILPGVTVGKQAIVGAGSMVTHDVPDNMVVAGTPAKILRERRTEGRSGESLDHIWLF